MVTSDGGLSSFYRETNATNDVSRMTKNAAWRKRKRVASRMNLYGQKAACHRHHRWTPIPWDASRKAQPQRFWATWKPEQQPTAQQAL